MLSNEEIATNAMAQIAPESFDPNLSPRENVLKRLDRPDPGMGVTQSAASGGMFSAAMPVDTSKPDDGYAQMLEEFRVDIADQLKADGDFIPAFEKAFFMSENMGDDIGTAIQTTFAHYLYKKGYHDFAEWVATDWQYGLTGNSDRGLDKGVYFNKVLPEEMYGPNWHTLTPDEMQDIRIKRRAEEVEEFYGDVEENTWAAGLGWFGAQLTDPINIIPTGQIALASKLIAKGGGTLASKAAAGAITGAAWNIAATHVQQQVNNATLDPAVYTQNAVFGAGVGAALPVLGHYLNRLWNKVTQNPGIESTAEDFATVKQDELSELQRFKEGLDSLPLPKDEAELKIALDTREFVQAQIDAIAKTDPVELASLANKAVVPGARSDARHVIDSAIRMSMGKSSDSLDYQRYVDSLTRKQAKYQLENIKTTPEYAVLAPEHKKIVDTYLENLQGTRPKVKAVKLSSKEKEAAANAALNKLADETTKDLNDFLDIINQFTPDFKYNLIQNVKTGALSSAAGYGTGYALTEDHDTALMFALATGGVAAGAPIMRKFYGVLTPEKALLDHPDPAIRSKAIADIKASRFKSFLMGQNYITNQNLTTQPHRQWRNRGGVGKYFSALMERADEEYKYSAAGWLSRYGSIMAHNDISASDAAIVARLMRKTIDPSDTSVLEKHKKAAIAMREQYNRHLDEAVATKIITKDAASTLKKQADDQGYLNRVYRMDYLQTKRGQQEFATAMANVKMSEEDVLSIIKALSGTKRKEALEEYKHFITKDGEGFSSLNFDGIRTLMKNSQGNLAQPAKFLERERSIPTHLEAVIEPFLITDLKDTYIKYVESLAKRTAYAKHFGPDGEKVHALAKIANAEWGTFADGKSAGFQMVEDYHGAIHSPNNEYIRRYFNQSTFYRHAKDPVAHLQNSKLIASAPLNLTQPLLYVPTLMAKFDIPLSKNFKLMNEGFKGAVDVLKTEYTRRGKSGREFVERTGAMIDSITYSATGDIASHQQNPRMSGLYGTVTDPSIWLKAGFEQAERWNRRVSAGAGRAIVEDTVSRKVELEALATRSTAQEKELTNLKRIMVELGLNPNTHPAQETIRAYDDAATYAGTILRDVAAPGAKEMAAQRVSNLTNFKSGYMDKPRLWSTPYGQWFGKFRTFALHGQNFIREDIIKPLANGNAMPLAIFISAGAPLGASVAAVKELLANDDQDRTRLEAWLNGVATIGLLGLMGDVAGQIVEHPRSLTVNLLGPVYADMIKAGNTAITNVSEGDIPGLAADLAEQAAKPALKFPAGIVSRAMDEENPFLAERQEKEAKERLKALGL